jgi:hypothetical protein
MDRIQRRGAKEYTIAFPGKGTVAFGNLYRRVFIEKCGEYCGISGTDAYILGLKAFFVQQTFYDHASHAAVTNETGFYIHAPQPIPDPWCHDQVNSPFGSSATLLLYTHTFKRETQGNKKRIRTE